SQSFVQTTREKRIFGKLTWDLLPGQKIAFTATIDPQSYDNQGIDTLMLLESGYTQRLGGRNLVLKDTAVFSPNVFLQTTLQSFESTRGRTPTLDPDTNGNGRVAFDRNRDGVIQATELDPGEDWDKDGAWDVFEEDSNHDKKLNNGEDVDNDKRITAAGV